MLQSLTTMIHCRRIFQTLLLSVPLTLQHGAAPAADTAASLRVTRIDADQSASALESLRKHLSVAGAQRPAVGEQRFAQVPLTREHAETARQILWKQHATQIREARTAEMQQRRVRDGELVMPFHYQVFGEKGEDGRRLFISLHGGGGAPKRLNDQQWENQKRLYRPREGVYLVPRAPTDTWNLWHQSHIDRMFDRLIENMIVFEDVDPNRVYLMGFSAGGDGVYQLAPRMADRLAAAAMMSGHPNDASPLGLRNIAFTIHAGGRDAAYNRNKVAREWQQKLATLHKEDPDGYVHLVKIYENKGHWLDREDAVALPWMARFRRDPVPPRVVWKQDDVTHERFYWLAVDGDDRQRGAKVVASYDSQTIRVETEDIGRLLIRLNDQMLDLDKPVVVMFQDRQLFSALVPRTIHVIAKTLKERGDPTAIFSGELSVRL